MESKLIGKRFGRLTVVRLHESDSRLVWVTCSCTPEKRFTTWRSNLVTGCTSSCSCLLREVAGKQSFIHGHCARRSPEYSTWQNFVQRCTNPNMKDYPNYGGKGITVCERWLVFTNFLEDMGERPDNCWLCRLDKNQGYNPANCYWRKYSNADDQN